MVQLGAAGGTLDTEEELPAKLKVELSYPSYFLGEAGPWEAWWLCTHVHLKIKTQHWLCLVGYHRQFNFFFLFSLALLRKKLL